MIHLHTLMRNTPNNIVFNAGKVRMLSQDTFVERDDDGDAKVCVATMRTMLRGAGKAAEKKKIRHTKIKLYGSRTPSGRMRKGTDTPCWVHCDCEYFLYYLEVAIAARGSSNVLTSNGNFPKIRNPRMKLYLCKHLLVAARQAWKAKITKTRRVFDITELELEDMVKLVQPFIPKRAL